MKAISTYETPITESISFIQARDGYDEYKEGTQALLITQYEGYYACLETERWAVTPNDLRNLADVLEKWLEKTIEDQEKLRGVSS